MTRTSASLLVFLMLGLSGCQGAGDTKTEIVDTRPKTGKELYEHWCAACHDAGPGHPGTLRMAGDFGEDRSVLIGNEDVSRELVKFAVRNGFNMMPPFRPTEISDEDLELLAEYVAEGEK